MPKKSSTMSPPAYPAQAAAGGIQQQQAHDQQASQTARDAVQAQRDTAQNPGQQAAVPECGGSMAATPDAMQEGLQQQMQQQAGLPAAGGKKGGALPPSMGAGSQPFSFF